MEDERLQMRKTSANLKGLVACLVVVTVGPFVSVGLVSSFLLARAFKSAESSTIDPSQKAALLGKGISVAMNGFAAGMLVSALAGVAAVVFGVRLYRERQAKGS